MTRVSGKSERYRAIGPVRTEGGCERTPVADAGASSRASRLVMVRPQKDKVTRPALEAFIADHRLLARLRHPQILQPLDYAADDRGFFFIEPEPAGVRLAELVARSPAKDPARPRAAGALAIQVSSALEAAHSCRDENRRGDGVTHGGLSPEAIWIEPNGKVWVGDFSLARFFDSRPRDRSDDVEALGRIFFSILGDERKALEIEPALAPVVALLRRCLSARRSERPAHAGEVAEALRRAVTADRAGLWRSELARWAGASEPAEPAAKATGKIPSRIPSSAMPPGPPPRPAAASSDDLIDAEAFWPAAPAEESVSEPARPPVVARPPRAPASAGPSPRPESPARAGVTQPRTRRRTGIENSLPGSPGAMVAAPETTPARLALLGGGGMLLAIGLFYLTGRLFCGPPESADDRAEREPPSRLTGSSDGGGDGDSAAVPVDAGAPARVVLEIVSDPPGAAISLDGNRRGVTPMQIDGWVPGVGVNIRLELSGYQVFEQRVVVDGAVPHQRVSMKLQPMDSCSAGRGWIRVTSEPSGAQVFLDDNPVGKTPAILSNVCGDLRHRLVIRAQGYRDETVEVSVIPGQVQSVQVKLKR